MSNSGDNIVNISSDKININTTSAKGLEKLISSISSFIIKVQDKFNKIVYGDIKKKYDPNKKSANTGDVNTALNNGLLYVVNEIASVDVCNIINYALNQQSNIIGESNFDPNIDPGALPPAEKNKWRIKKVAYDVQTYIDDYKKDYIDPKNINGKNKLFKLTNEINNAFNTTLLSPKEGLKDPNLVKDNPEVTILTNYIENALGFFNRYTDVRQIPNEDLQKLIQYVDRLRGVCIAIQKLKPPSSYINLISSIGIDSKLREGIDKIQKLVPIDKIIDLINIILNTANNINSIAKSILSYVNIAMVLIRIIVLLIKIFKMVQKFLKKLPIPNLYTTTGETTTISSTESKLNKFIEDSIKRLEQINSVLVLITILITNIIIVIDEIIQKLIILKLNIESCQNPLLDNINKTIDNLNNTKKDLQSFVDNYNNNKNNVNNKFGNYTISIVSEELADEGISLKRRYGVALDSRNIVVVSTTPTFASLDLIIINEVKVQLVSKGLVDADLKSLSTEEIQTLTESLNYLQEGDININDISTDLQDTNFESDTGLGSFIDNLSGGRKLRKKVKSAVQSAAAELQSNLSSTDANNNYGKSTNIKF